MELLGILQKFFISGTKQRRIWDKKYFRTIDDNDNGEDGDNHDDDGDDDVEILEKQSIEDRNLGQKRCRTRVKDLSDDGGTVGGKQRYRAKVKSTRILEDFGKGQKM